ncbi:MAG TPA: hypothetical protein VMW10_01870, partial [Alphaproteobacteria bacterium]|nr:hypothetical protein [Alphaproteobacteria bacterium]
RSPFLQFLAHRHSTFENSTLIGLSVPPHLLPMHTYASHQFGSTISKPQHQTAPHTVLDVLRGIQKEYETHKEKPESFEVNKEEKRRLHPEARLSLHPNFIFHKGVQMKAFNRFPLSPSEQKQFDREMRTATIGTLANWLVSHLKIMPGSYIKPAIKVHAKREDEPEKAKEPYSKAEENDEKKDSDNNTEIPALRRLYDFAYVSTTGKTPPERFAFASLFHLASNNHLDGVKEFLKNYPKIIEDKDFDPKSMIYNLLRKNHRDMLVYFLDEVFKVSPRDYFKTQTEFYKAIRICITQYAPDCLDYLLSHLSLKEVPDQLVRVWSHQVIFTESSQLAAVLLKHFPEFTSKVLRSFVRSNFEEEDLDVLITAGISPVAIIEEWLSIYNQLFFKTNLNKILNIMAKYNIKLGDFQTSKEEPFDSAAIQSKILHSFFETYVQKENLKTLSNFGIVPETLVDEWISAHRSQRSPDRQNDFFVLDFIAEHKIDLTRPHPETGIPLIFEIISLNSSQLLWGFESYFYSQLSLLANFPDPKGKTLFDHAHQSIEEQIHNPVLALLRPYAFWRKGKSYSYEPWYSKLYCAFLLKDTSEIERLSKNIPSIVVKSELIKLLKYENDYPDIFRKINEKISEVEKRVEEARQALHENDCLSFYNIFNNSPEVLNMLDPLEMDKYSLKHSHSSSQVEHKSEEESPKDDEQLEDGERTTQCSSLVSVFEDNNYDRTLRYLEQAYPDRKEFIALKTIQDGAKVIPYHPFVWALAEEKSEAFFAIIDYMGKDFPKLAYAVGKDIFPYILKQLSEERARKLTERFPDLFTHVDEENDFFIRSLTNLPSEVRKEFIVKYKDKLREIDPQFGFFYFYWIFSGKNMPILAELVKCDPSLLELKTLDGLTHAEICIDVTNDKRSFQKKMKKLELLSGNVKEEKIKGEKI